MKLQYITWMPAFFMMILIFSFSSKPAVSSNQSSMTIANAVISNYEVIAHTHFEGEKRIEIIEMINHVVRKGAHFSEYALLSCLVACHILVLGVRGKQLTFLPVVISACYAMTDEFHQTFVPGRGGRITDVLIDTSGALFGALCFLIIVAIVSGFMKKSLLRSNETV